MRKREKFGEERAIAEDDGDLKRSPFPSFFPPFSKPPPPPHTPKQQNNNSIPAATKLHPTADVFINFASFRSAFESSMQALKEPTLRVVAVIAEGVPESDAKRLIAAASGANKLLIGPATVGGLQAGAFRFGDAAGTIEYIVECGLHRRGSVGFVSKSGGMSNECYSVLSRATDGLYEGVAIGGDSFPGSTLSDHALRYEAMPGVKMIVVLGVRKKVLRFF